MTRISTWLLIRVDDDFKITQTCSYYNLSCKEHGDTCNFWNTKTYSWLYSINVFGKSHIVNFKSQGWIYEDKIWRADRINCVDIVIQIVYFIPLRSIHPSSWLRASVIAERGSILIICAASDDKLHICWFNMMHYVKSFLILKQRTLLLGCDYTLVCATILLYCETQMMRKQSRSSDTKWRPTSSVHFWLCFHDHPCLIFEAFHNV